MVRRAASEGDQAILTRPDAVVTYTYPRAWPAGRRGKQQLRIDHNARDQRRVQPAEQQNLVRIRSAPGIDCRRKLHYAKTIGGCAWIAESAGFLGGSARLDRWNRAAVRQRLPFKVPTATTNLSSFIFQGTNVDRVPGVPRHAGPQLPLFRSHEFRAESSRRGPILPWGTLVRPTPTTTITECSGGPRKASAWRATSGSRRGLACRFVRNSAIFSTARA